MDLEISTPISAEAEVKQYTLVGDDIYVKRYTNENIPTWYRELVSSIIAGDNTITDIQGAIDYLSSLPAGYNLQITELQNADTTINTALTSLVATTGSHTAAIANLGITKVDSTSAQAIALNTIGTYFADGSAGAWFNNQISTYASDIAANAMNISTLSATVDGQTVMIENVESIAINAGNWAANASKLITNPQGQITGWSFGDGSNTKSFFDIYADNFRVVNSTYNFVPFSISGSDILFNGKVQFTNVTGTPVINQTFVQTTAPTSGMVAGDTWLDSDGGYAVYTYSGSSWVAGGSKTYSQTSAPTSGMVAGDLWIDTDDNNKLYRYDGTSWVNQTITSGGIISAINGTTNTTTIDGGKITTGSITTAQLNATDIKAGNIFVDNILRSSDFTTIGGAGFRLKSNAAGTSADPTIYGAYIRGSRISGSIADAQSLTVYSSNYPNNSGRIFNSTWNDSINAYTAISDIWYGEAYSNGFVDNRICNSSSLIVITAVNGNIGNAGAYIQVSIDGGAYSTIYTATNSGSARPISVKYVMPPNAVTLQFKCIGINTSSYVFGIKVDVSNI